MNDVSITNTNIAAASMIPRSGEPPVFSADDMIGGFNWGGSLPPDPE
jgi:hypothetical protein